MKSAFVFGFIAVTSAFLAGLATSAQLGKSAATGDPLDAVVAAPKNHKLLYEDDHIRVLEVSIQPGETEKLHHHPYPSVFVFDASQPSLRDSAAGGATLERNWAPPKGVVLDPKIADFLDSVKRQLETSVPNGVPAAVPVGGVVGAHQVSVIDNFPAHFYRIEFKRMDGKDIMSRRSY